MGLIGDNLKIVNAQIADACYKFGRRREDIMLVGISKTKGVDVIKEACQAGLTHLGENRIQEASEKIPIIGEGPVWHMVGHLQSNKAKKAVGLFDIIESIDSLKLAKVIGDECAKIGKKMKILLEVNSSGEASKYGLQPGDVLAFAVEINKLENLELSGLMTVGPFTNNLEQIDKSFDLTQKLYKQMQDKFGAKISILSMGMSSDFERAIKYGNTELRIGTAIFGARNVII
ncbi:MAG: YggS family pyridoxal phosphate-dependent enzyme [candidate division Zixibacteria bacterium]|nr:YggS family pyridoxal phosphate-dependent enzyme [candidate division Zixibacteria bacterium]